MTEMTGVATRDMTTENGGVTFATVTIHGNENPETEEATHEIEKDVSQSIHVCFPGSALLKCSALVFRSTGRDEELDSTRMGGTSGRFAEPSCTVVIKGLTSHTNEPTVVANTELAYATENCFSLSRLI
jgi:hypothetical protein